MCHARYFQLHTASSARSLDKNYYRRDLGQGRLPKTEHYKIGKKINNNNMSYFRFVTVLQAYGRTRALKSSNYYYHFAEINRREFRPSSATNRRAVAAHYFHKWLNKYFPSILSARTINTYLPTIALIRQ